MLIHGGQPIALKALESKFAEQVKYIYIEKYRKFKDDVEYLEHFDADYNDRAFGLLEIFSNFQMRVKQNPKI